MPVDLAVQLVATFDCAPMLEPLGGALRQKGVAEEAKIAPPSQLREHMLAPSRESENMIGTIVLVRMEDWLRDSLMAEAAPQTTSAARPQLRKQMDEFLSELTVVTLRGRPVWLMICPSQGWVAEKSGMATLCRTMNNLFAVRVRNISGVELLAWPASFAMDELSDRRGDADRHAPFTQTGYDQLAETISQQLAESVAARDPEASTGSASGSPELAAFLAGLHVRLNLAPATSI